MALNRYLAVGKPAAKAPKPAVKANRAPGSGDKNYVPGQVWIDLSALDAYTLVGFSNGVPQWMNTAGGGGSYSSLTVTPGPTALTGAFTVTSGTENVSIGADAADHDVSIGSATGSSALVVQWGTGNAVLAGAAGGTVTIGAAAQTGAMTFGRSTAANTLNIGTGVNTGAQVVNVSTGAAAADSTLNIMSGIATAGTQTINVFSGASTSTGQALNIMTGGAGSGTRAVNIGGGGVATTIALGNNVASSLITLNTADDAGVVITDGTQTARLIVGTGSPDTAVTAPQGSLFINVAGGADTILYVNTNGMTAWTALTST